MTVTVAVVVLGRGCGGSGSGSSRVESVVRSRLKDWLDRLFGVGRLGFWKSDDES